MVTLYPTGLSTDFFAAGLLYAIGGFDGVSPLKSVEQYDPATDQWMSLPGMASKRFGLGACACGGKYIMRLLGILQTSIFTHARDFSVLFNGSVGVAVDGSHSIFFCKIPKKSSIFT